MSVQTQVSSAADLQRRSSPLEIVTEVWVPGLPKTKGSLDFKGKGRVVEGVKGSKEWRQAVAYAVAYDRGLRGLADRPVPAGVPVGVRILFVLPVPVAVHKSALVGDIRLVEHAPTETRSGDIDKLCRNVLDALTDAGAYTDDVQVCRLIASKVYADGLSNGSDVQGALIQAWVMPRFDLLASRRIQRLAVLPG